MTTQVPLFDLGESPTFNDLMGAPGFAEMTFDQKFKFARTRIKAISTKKFRCPKKGEWYLSGAIPQAWRAPNDLSSSYYIARLVVVETRVIEEIQIISKL